MAKEQLPLVTKKMRDLRQESLLFVYDRGYVSVEAIAQHIDLNVDFIFRIQKGMYNHIWHRIEKGEVDFEDTIDGHQIKAVAITLSTGEIELLVTSLKDKQKITLEHLNRLYELRWRIEKCYKKNQSYERIRKFLWYKIRSNITRFLGPFNNMQHTNSIYLR